MHEACKALRTLLYSDHAGHQLLIVDAPSEDHVWVVQAAVVPRALIVMEKYPRSVLLKAFTSRSGMGMTTSHTVMRAAFMSSSTVPLSTGSLGSGVLAGMFKAGMGLPRAGEGTIATSGDRADP